MSSGRTAIEKLYGNRITVFVDGPLTLVLGRSRDVKAQSDMGVSITPGSRGSLKVKSPAEAGSGTVASGERAVAVGGTLTGIIVTGENAIVDGKPVNDPPSGSGMTVEVPAGIIVQVYRAASITVDSAAEAAITVVDLRR